MAALMVTCPLTARPIATGIEIDPGSLRSLPAVESVVYCPACGEKHFWTCHDAFIQVESRAIDTKAA